MTERFNILRNFVSIFAVALLTSHAANASADVPDVAIPDPSWNHPALPLPENRLQDANSEWAIDGVHMEPPALQDADTPQPWR